MLSHLLRDQGIQSEFFALNTDLVDKLILGYDYHIPYHIDPFKRRLLEVYYLWKILAKYDVIHFHFNTFLSLDNGWELPYLKKMGKVLVFHFRGCDLRQKSINVAKNPELNCCQGCDYPEGSCDTEYQQARLAKARKYGDLFFVTTPDLLDFFPKAEHIPFIAPYGIDLESIPASPRKNGVFRIVTSSNHPGVDGVPSLREAVSKLQMEGSAVELIEVTDKPLREALSIYRSADLFAGKLCMGYYNNANIETLGMGIPNMAYIRDGYLKGIPDCPIIIARPDNIYEKLKEWMAKPGELKRLGTLGPAFVKKYHDPSRIAAKLISEYNRVWLNKRDASRRSRREIGAQ